MTGSALFSVSDKSNIVPFAKTLHERGYRILSTGGTATYLRENGVDVVDVSDVTNFPEIFDGRVKTLNPIIHGGILARRDVAKDLKTMNDHGISPIDIVVVNLYPFEDTVASDADDAEVIEKIDIGGPCMLRAAAKNFQHVYTICDLTDCDAVADALDADGDTQLTLRIKLAKKAFHHTWQYESAIAEWFDPITPTILDRQRTTLRYGENPHQKAWLHHSEQPYVTQLHGKELSYNNIVDLDGALGLLEEFEVPAAAIIKHTNPAGCAIADSIDAAFELALAGDPISAFGGIVVLNRPVTKSLAETLNDTFFEIICAPRFDDDAFAVLQRKKQRRLLSWDRCEGISRHYRTTRLGILQLEDDPRIAFDPSTLEVPTQRVPTDVEWSDLGFAWRVCKHVKSNAIVLAQRGTTIGIGAGQMSRVDAVRIAVEKSDGNSVGTVLASDAFFPFRDGPEAAGKAGVTAIVQPGGSKRDGEVIDACNALGIAMVFTKTRHFKH